jgi:hypothetical protein
MQQLSVRLFEGREAPWVCLVICLHQLHPCNADIHRSKPIFLVFEPSDLTFEITCDIIILMSLFWQEKNGERQGKNVTLKKL